jgi:hypothetical protein
MLDKCEEVEVKEILIHPLIPQLELLDVCRHYPVLLHRKLEFTLVALS